MWRRCAQTFKSKKFDLVWLEERCNCLNWEKEWFVCYAAIQLRLKLCATFQGSVDGYVYDSIDSIKASDFASWFNMCTSCFASSSFINPDLLQDKKIQRDLMSTWPLAAKPLESRWFGVEELPEAENLSK